MLQIYNEDKKRIATITNVSDLCIEKTLEYGDRKITFKYPRSDVFAEELKVENYIRTKEDEYVIKSVSEDTERNEYIAQLNIEELESKQFISGFTSNEQMIKDTLTVAFKNTPWKIGTCEITKKRTIQKDSQCNAWEVLKDCISTYRCEIKINSLEKTIDIYEKIGVDKGAYFMEDLNLKKLNRKTTSYDFFNVIIPLGKDDLSMSVGGKNYIENFQYTKKRITRIWKDERYTNVEALIEDATAKVEESSRPLVAYSADVYDLVKNNSVYKNVLDYDVGDYITIISKEKKTRTKQRIVKLKEYPMSSQKNNVELSNARKTFVELQKSEADAAKQGAATAAKSSTYAISGRSKNVDIAPLLKEISDLRSRVESMEKKGVDAT